MSFSPEKLAEQISEISLRPQVIHAIHYCYDFTVLKLLVDFGHARVNVISDEGEWPLKLFAREGDLLAIAYLLERGAEPNLTSTGETALHAAVRSGNRDCVRILIDAGANPNQQDVDMCVPLCWAKNVETVDLLVSAGADCNLRDQAGFLPSQWIKDIEAKRYVKSREVHA